jgi:1-acyl-sn-glycerol-3-phosphate acyltransferase
MIRALLQPFYTAYVLLLFLVCLLTAYPFFLLIGSRDRPEARMALWYIVHYWAIGWFWAIGMPIRKRGYDHDFRERSVIIANHISYLDTVAIYAAIPSYFRTLAKKEMAAIPIFGFVYKQMAILVERSSTHSRSKSLRLMWRAIKNESHITIFPEGTFNETGAPLKSFYDGAFRLAITTQAPIVPLVLPDTVWRWHYSAWWKLWPGRNLAIYLPPVPTKGLTMQDLPTLKKQVYEMMETELAKYPVPTHSKKQK